MTAFSRGTERRMARSGSRATVARVSLLLAIGLSIAVAGITLLRGFQPITDSQTDASLTGQPFAVPDTALNLQTLLSANGSHPAGSYRTAPPAPATAIDGSNFYLPLVQARRQGASLPALIVDDGLSHIALIRANQMASQDYVGTVDPAGYAMFRELLARAGYTYTCR